jgi:hypothetical protein
VLQEQESVQSEAADNADAGYDSLVSLLCCTRLNSCLRLLRDGQTERGRI